jgi:hypothetical protein
MITTDAFVIDMGGSRKTRSDYRRLSTSDVIRLITLAEVERTQADTDDDLFDAEFALQELRAVIEERR